MIRLLISLVLLATTVTFFGQKADDIIGEYHLPNQLDVAIYKQEGKYFGKIIALNNYSDGQNKDVKNPKKAMKDDLLLGKVIIKNLEFNPHDKQWKNGTMYGVDKGIILNLDITEYNKTNIKVIGSKALFWKTLIWLKI